MIRGPGVLIAIEMLLLGLLAWQNKELNQNHTISSIK